MKSELILFFEQNSQFPTVIFSILLAVIFIYWLFVMVGFFDIELFDVDLEVDSNYVSGFFVSLGLSGVPFSVVLSLLVLISWLSCYFISRFLLIIIEGSFWYFLASIITIIISFLMALPITVRLIRPLKKIFVVHHAVSNQQFIGKRCEIRTLQVNETFGQALFEDGQAGMLLNVRMPSPNNLTKGDFATISSYNSIEQTYQIIPETVISSSGEKL